MVKGYWYCPNCKMELENNQVTYYEKCNCCGASVLSVEDEISSEELTKILIARKEGRLQIKDNSLHKLINNLNDTEKELLKIASNAIYFDDNSDYCTALWDIVNLISGKSIEECNSELFDLLNKE